MNKYRSVKTDGYHSKKEAKRAADLRFLSAAGEITNLREQVKYELIPSLVKEDGSKERSCNYIADFVYEMDGKLVVEDCKGFRTPDYVIKRKLMLFRYGVTIKET